MQRRNAVRLPRKRALAAAVALVALGGLALAPAQPAASARPTIVVQEVDFHQSVPFLCGFPLERSVTGTEKTIQYSDGSYRVLALDLVDTWTSPLTGKSLSGRSVGMTTYEIADDGTVVQTIVGLSERFVVPGAGAIVLVAGRFVFTYNQNDPTVPRVQLQDAGPREGLRGLCPYLEP